MSKRSGLLSNSPRGCGKFWLCLDSAFKQQDQFRVSYGCLMVLAAGLGQGAEAFILSLDVVPLATRSIGVAVGAGPRLVDRLQTHSLLRRGVDVADVAWVVA